MLKLIVAAALAAFLFNAALNVRADFSHIVVRHHAALAE